MKRLFSSNPSKAVNTAFLMLLIFLSVSCGSLPTLTSVEPADWAMTVARKDKITRWDVKARLGIQTENNGGSFDLFWNQAVSNYMIRLIAPFGQGALTIEGDSEKVIIRDSQGITQNALNPDVLIRQNLGVDFPLASLRWWMLGLPDKKLKIETISWNESGQVHYLQQAGWEIEMLAYKTVGESVLPHTFVLQREDSPQLRIRLLIKQWAINGE